MEPKIYKCFIASPGDTKKEREICDKVFDKINEDMGKLCNFKIIAVKWENIPPDVGRYPQEVISRYIDNCDIFIGIMFKKFGTPTSKAGSGIEEEFDYAYKKYKKDKTPKIMFYFNNEEVNTKEMDTNELNKVKIFKSNISEKGVFYREYNGCSNFEEYLTKHLNDYFIGEYKTELESIKKLRIIVRNKCSEILNKCPSIKKGFSMRELLEEMYIQPHSNVKKDEELHTYISNISEKKILIRGDGGVGKTTLLAKIYCEMANSFLNSNIYPLYLSLNGKPLCGITIQVSLEFEPNIDLKVFNYECCQYIILIDGLDEVQCIKEKDEIQSFLDSKMFLNNKVIVAGRENFVQDYSEINEHFYTIMIFDYKNAKEKQLELLDKFYAYDKARKNRFSNGKQLKIEQYINENFESLQNPLILSLFLIYMQDVDDISGRKYKESEILEVCVNDAIIRQCHKKDQSDIDISFILKELSLMSWKIYRNRLILKDTVYDHIKYDADKYTTQEIKLIDECIDLFTYRSGSNKVVKMENEGILEYFYAKYMIYVFTNEITDELDLFSIHIKVEIIRHALNLMSESQKSIAFNYLVNVYKDTDDKGFHKIHQIVHILPRINNIDPMSFLNSEYDELRKHSIFSGKRSAIEHCLLQLGKNPELEEEYYNRMVNDMEFDSFVRGGYLVYYQNPRQQHIISFPYYDRGGYNWDRVFDKCFKQHISEDKEGKKRKFVRRLEFRLAKQFIETRKNVSSEIAQFYRDLSLTPESYNFNDQVKAEYYSLLETINKYESKSGRSEHQEIS